MLFWKHRIYCKFFQCNFLFNEIFFYNAHVVLKETIRARCEWWHKLFWRTSCLKS